MAAKKYVLSKFQIYNRIINGDQKLLPSFDRVDAV